MVQNKGLIFKKVPDGLPVVGEHIAVETRDFDLNSAPPKGAITTKNLYSSFDPYMRGRLRPAHVKSYTPPYELGAPLTNWSVGRVLKSASDRFKEGDVVVSAAIGLEEYSIVPAQIVADKYATYAAPSYYPDIDVRQYTGALGMSGLTAYSSLEEIGKPQKGETIFISSAAGSVGQLVGQISKAKGLRVIGSVGSDEKLELITKQLGFDAGFNYKKEKPADALKRLAPKGIDIYYENVGGEHLEAALDALNVRGRIVACGMISQYNAKPHERYGVPNLANVIGKRLTIRGFIVFDSDFGPKYFDEHQREVGKWIADGSFKPQLHMVEGIDRAAEGLVELYKGDNFGKSVLQVAEHHEGAPTATKGLVSGDKTRDKKRSRL